MPPRKQWAVPRLLLPPTRRANKFDDEEGDDSDVLEDWDAAEDSEVEREKVKKAAEAKAKADAEAAANKKSKAQRVAELKAQRAAALAAADEFDDESETDRRARLRRTEQEADLKHAEDLFGDIGVPAGRTATKAGAAVAVDSKDPNNTVNIANLPLFNPTTKTQFEALRNTLVPLIGAHSKKPHYTLFLQEFAKQLAKDLPSDQVKKISSTLTALSNEKLREEKAADKGGKKSKAQKTKVSVVANRPKEDIATYEDDFGDDDFM
ncbi:unnamed protein product [Parascedosporium putredinis]|uniref:Eukaryotic translation initiation factor 3 subunit J n=1 Tax=Parascedosporium putredinis TaxID=1442378 RepID=A0A9P1H778_9PEZI|nr:unnamed protein product [Parascedosporium putredinis]CAI7998645.1 unnamed protein product [Parascedosporium putredinis]